MLRAIDFHLRTVREVALVGPDEGVARLAAVVRSTLRPGMVLAGGDGSDSPVPLLRDRDPIDGVAAAYVCEHFACRRPVTEPDELTALLAASPGPGSIAS